MFSVDGETYKTVRLVHVTYKNKLIFSYTYTNMCFVFAELIKVKVIFVI